MKTQGIVTVTEGDSINFREPTDIFICDPCYVITHSIPHLDKAWQDFCSLMFEKPRVYDRGGMAYVDTELGQAKLLYQSTAYGDGDYDVHCSCKKEGYSCGVDAGMLSIMSVADVIKIRPDFTAENFADYGVVIRDFKGIIHTDGEGNWSGSNGFSLKTEWEEEYTCYNCGCNEVDYDGEQCSDCEDEEFHGEDI